MSRYSKLIAALVGVVSQLVALGVVDESVNEWVAVVIALLTALGVYVVPNKAPA